MVQGRVYTRVKNIDKQILTVVQGQEGRAKTNKHTISWPKVVEMYIRFLCLC